MKVSKNCNELLQILERAPKILVVTGAGISTPSQIPDYRDNDGNWKRSPPIMFQDFMKYEQVRKRYWGRSLVGWHHFSKAKPNAAHYALTDLEKSGRIQQVVTQNVDDLHQQAGQKRLLTLHGTLDKVRCMSCDDLTARAPFQEKLVLMNPLFADLSAPAAPDGDADLDHINFNSFRVPHCLSCGGILKPDAVFYGETVPADRHRIIQENLAEAKVLLIVGSSLMVYSGFRIAKRASELGIPIVAINNGATRADALITLKVTDAIESTLPILASALRN